MNQNVIAILIKLGITLATAWIAFGLLGPAAFPWILALTAVATALNYVVGDLVVLPRYGNIIAVAGDGLLAAVTAVILDALFPGVQTTAATLVLFAILIAGAEYAFHRYLLATKAAP